MNPPTGHEQLVKLCLRGDQKAQYKLYELYSTAMFNVCCRMMSNREEAEDALQNAFVDIFRNLSSYRGDATLGAWIKRIVVNNCLNIIKKRKLEMVDLKDHHGGSVDPDYRPFEDAGREVARIKGALTQLPDGYRVIFTMYAFEGYDHKEIAEILGITEGGSKSQFSRAKQKLKSILTHES